MDTPNKYLVPERNAITHAKHRKEVFWQITLPMLIGLLLALLVVVVIIFSTTTTAADLSRWADVSTIWLILPSLVITLIFLAILIAFTYLISVVLKFTPRYARIVQIYFEIGRYRISHIADQITDPIIKTHSIWAVVRHPGRWGRRPVDEK
jgi:uncharacterized membrane protein